MVAYTTGADWGTHAHKHIHTPNRMTVLKVYSVSLESQACENKTMYAVENMKKKTPNTLNKDVGD